MNNLENIYVGEYSIEQETFHIEKLVDAIEINKRLIKNNQKNINFLPIVCGNDYKEVSEKLEEIKNEIRKEK